MSLRLFVSHDSMLYNCETVGHSEDILKMKAFSLSNFVSAIVLDMSEEGRQELAISVGKVEFERKQEEEAERKDKNPRRSAQFKGRDDPGPVIFDPADVDFDSGHYENDVTNSRIKKALFDIADLQVSVLCALDALIVHSFKQGLRVVKEDMAELCVNIPSFAQRFGQLMGILVKFANSPSSRSAAPKMRAFFTFQYFHLLQRMCTSTKWKVYCEHMIDHQFDAFRYALFDDEWMEEKLLINMKLLFNQKSFDIMQNVEERLCSLAPHMKSESGFGKTFS